MEAYYYGLSIVGSVERGLGVESDENKSMFHLEEASLVVVISERMSLISNGRVKTAGYISNKRTMPLLFMRTGCCCCCLLNTTAFLLLSLSPIALSLELLSLEQTKSIQLLTF